MKIKLVIGLGNPAPEYENTYHNLGHLAVNFLDRRAAGWRSRLPKLKTNVFMNESGGFVRAALKKGGLKIENLLIIHDDADIELGQYKLSFGRGSAGHKGVQNIIDQLKTKNFWRLRIGIRPPRSKAKADDLVLKKISQTHAQKIENLITSAWLSIEKKPDLPEV